ncbi:MAG: hypothetical protein QW331_00950 [Candidatus Woesearchaeota archaeon]
MKDKFKEAIANWEYHDIKLFQKELERGGRALKELLDNRLIEIEEKESNNVCPTCNEYINKEENHYALIFCSKAFRKRANFCAADCLMYFVNKMNELEKDSRKKQKDEIVK